MKTLEIKQGEYSISTDKQKLDVTAIHQFLEQDSYWAKGISIEKVQRAIDHSLCFGVYHMENLVGFARVVTDFTTFAYIGDVFITIEHRGLGLSKWLMETILGYPDLQNLRRWVITTADAHTLYEKYGFTSLTKPERYMEKFQPDVYLVSI